MNIKEKVIGIIANVTQEENIHELLAQNDDLKQFDFTSITFIKLIIEIENEFEIEFDDDALDINGYSTLQDLCDYLEERTKV